MKRNPNIRRITALILCLLLCLTIFCAAEETESSAEAPSSPPYIDGSAALLIELNTGTVLYEQDADKTIYPASLTKIMTCLLTLEGGNLSDMVTVSSSAWDDLEDEADKTLLVGETMTLENLLYCMMISSDNESCNVAAEYVSGSIRAFVELMNERAAELGCTGTHFANPHGLHDENHYTTARDLSRIVREAIKNPTFRTLVSTWTYSLPPTNLSEKRTLTTTNKLIIPKPENDFYDKRVTGVKTGFTTPAGRCLIATAENDDLKLLSVVCGCATTVLPEGGLQFESFPETEKLLEYGFSGFVVADVLNTLYPLSEIPVSRGAGSGFVSLAPTEKITALLPAGYDPERITTEIRLISEDGVTAPVSAGDQLGEISVRYGDQELGVVPLAAITDVARATIWDIFRAPAGSPAGWLRVLLAVTAVLILLILLLVLLSRRKRRKARRRRRISIYEANGTARHDPNERN